MSPDPFWGMRLVVVDDLFRQSLFEEGLREPEILMPSVHVAGVIITSWIN